MKLLCKIFCYSVLLLFLNSCSSYESFRQENEFKVDGKTDDWNLNMVSHKSGNYAYWVGNDDENIYVQLKITNPQIQQKLALRGLTMWIDTSGSTKKKMGIRFPVGKTGELSNIKPESDQFSKSRAGERKQRVKRDLKTLLENRVMEAEFIGFDNNPGTRFILLQNNPYDIKISINIDEYNTLNYEAIIPMRSVVSDPNVLLKGQEALSIGFVTGYFDMQMRSQAMQRPGGGRPAGGGMQGMGGGKGMGGFQADREDMMELFEPTKIWIKKINLK